MAYLLNIKPHLVILIKPLYQLERDDCWWRGRVQAWRLCDSELQRKHFPLVRGCAYWQWSPFLHPSDLRKKRQTGLSASAAPLGLGLAVGIAVWADRGCCARSTCWSTWSSRARALARTTSLRQASWRLAMVISSLSPLSRKIATHSVMKILSEVWRGFPTFTRTATARLCSMCADTSSATTNLVIQFSSHAANWNMLVGNLAGKVYSSSTKSNLVASSVWKISFQHMNRIVGEPVHPTTTSRTPAFRESHSGGCARSSCRSNASTSHKWLEQALCGQTNTSSRMQIYLPYLIGAIAGSFLHSGDRLGANRWQQRHSMWT